MVKTEFYKYKQKLQTTTTDFCILESTKFFTHRHYVISDSEFKLEDTAVNTVSDIF